MYVCCKALKEYDLMKVIWNFFGAKVWEMLNLIFIFFPSESLIEF